MTDRRMIRFPVPEGSRYVGDLQVMIEDFMARRDLYEGTRHSAGNTQDSSYFIQATNDEGERNLTELQAWLARNPNIVWEWREESPDIRWY